MVKSYTSLLSNDFSTGQSGLGKSTLINSLFMTDIFEDSAYEGSAYRAAKTTQVEYLVLSTGRTASLIMSIDDMYHVSI